MGGAFSDETVEDDEPIPIKKLTRPERLCELYKFDEENADSQPLGAFSPNSGPPSPGQIRRAKCRESGAQVVIKVRSKDCNGPEGKLDRSLLRQIMGLDHNHVLGLHEVLEDSGAYYMVMPFCNGGDFFDFMTSSGTVSDSECKRIVKQVLLGIDYMHSQGLLHRDIKPENIMFHSPTSNIDNIDDNIKDQGLVKLIDLDTCVEWAPDSPSRAQVIGTLGYLAPEVFLGQYSPASDLFSVGVILYNLKTKTMPFSEEFLESALRDNRVGGHATRRLYELLKDSEVDFESDPWPACPGARALCEKLLAFEPENRIASAHEALLDPWLAED